MGTNAAKYLFRVTLDSSAGSIYTDLRKFVFNISTGGFTNVYVKIYIRTKANVSSSTDTWNVWNKTSKTWVLTTDSSATDANTKCYLNGWSGYNVINVSNFTFGSARDNQYQNVRFVFGAETNTYPATSDYPASTYGGGGIYSILGYGGMGWNASTNLGRIGHLYTWDGNETMILPNGLQVNTDGTSNVNIQSRTTGSVSYGSTNPRLRFTNSDASQTLELIFTDFDNVTSPASFGAAPSSLSLTGNQGGEWLFVPRLGIHGYNSPYAPEISVRDPSNRDFNLYYSNSHATGWNILKVRPGDSSGVGVTVGYSSGGSMIIGAGESPFQLNQTLFTIGKNPYTAATTAWSTASEMMFISSDNEIYFMTGMQSYGTDNHTDWTDVKTAIFDNYGAFRPSINNKGSIGDSTRQWSTIYGGTIYENGTSLANKYLKFDTVTSNMDANNFLTTTGWTNVNVTNGTNLPTTNWGILLHKAYPAVQMWIPDNAAGIYFRRKADSSTAASAWWGITGTAGTTYNLDVLPQRTVTGTTLDSQSGSFAFSGSGAPWAGTDWVGLQIGDSVDKFQITVNDSVILVRQNDSGGTDSTHWGAWNKMFSTSGGTMTGNIVFDAVTSESYPASSYGLNWSGSTDWAKIYYRVDANDAGRLVFDIGDDNNVRFDFAYGGTTKAYINYEGGASFSYITSAYRGSFATQATTSTADGDLYANGALEIRETGRQGSAVSSYKNAPRIGFHWSGRIAASLYFHNDGLFYFRKQNGTSRATIDANVTGKLLALSTITYGEGGLQWKDLSTTASDAKNDPTKVCNPVADWFHHIILNHSNSNGYYVDIAACFHSNYIAYRRIQTGQDKGWVRLCDSSNSIYNGIYQKCYSATSTAGWRRILTMPSQNSSGYTTGTFEFHFRRQYNNSAPESFGIRVVCNYTTPKISLIYSNSYSASTKIMPEFRVVRASDSKQVHFEIYYNLTLRNAFSVRYFIHQPYLMGGESSPTFPTENYDGGNDLPVVNDNPVVQATMRIPTDGTPGICYVIYDDSTGSTGPSVSYAAQYKYLIVTCKPSSTFAISTITIPIPAQGAATQRHSIVYSNDVSGSSQPTRTLSGTIELSWSSTTCNLTSRTAAYYVEAGSSITSVSSSITANIIKIVGVIY